MAAKGSSKPKTIKAKRITGKQRVARIRNIAVARKSKQRGIKSFEKKKLNILFRGGISSSDLKWK